MEYEKKIFFKAGDIVKVKHNLPYTPTMLVKKIDKIIASGGASGSDNGRLLGVTCIWFSVDMEIQEYRFNTKDLIHVGDA